MWMAFAPTSAAAIAAESDWTRPGESVGLLLGLTVAGGGVALFGWIRGTFEDSLFDWVKPLESIGGDE
jgi:hypothetical protein